MTNNKKVSVLVINYASLGDVILCTPLLRALKMQLENSVVHLCSYKKLSSSLKENPYVDSIHSISEGKEISSIIKLVRKNNYDHIIDLTVDFNTFIAQLFSLKSFKRLDKLKFKKWLFSTFKINKLPNLHIVDRFIQTASGLNIKKDQFGLDYFIPTKDEVEIDWLPEDFRQDYIVYNIAARYKTRQMPFNKMIELCDKINKPIVLLGTQQEYELGKKIEDFFTKTNVSQPYEEKLKELGKKAVVFNACGKFNESQIASVIKQAKYVFSHDHDYMHMAAAFKKTIFSIWGNTKTYYGYYPYKTKFTVWENNKLKCRPCSSTGYNKCPKQHFNCMNKITFDFWLP